MKKNLISLTFISILVCVSTFTAHAQIKLNEIQSSNATTIANETGKFSDWIELYNTSSSSVNIGGYYITDNRDRPRKWQVPNNTTISGRGYLLIWCDGYDVNLHTNFKLSATEGEWLLVYSSEMLLIDSLKIPPIATDYSYGRTTDGTGNWDFLASPTPGKKNTSQTIKGPAPAPTFSIPGGFYSSNQNVSLASSLSGAVIRYTTDGSEPTESSPVYSGAISTSKTSNTTLKNGYNAADNTNIQRYTWPATLVSSTVYTGNRDLAYVIKAKVFHTDYAPSKTVASTYFIGMRRPSLPVVSISTDRAGFFDASQGMYIQGTNGATKKFDGMDLTANWLHDDWERKVHIEYFDKNGQRQFGVNAGAQVMGAVSRNTDMKSLKIVLRNEYGDPVVNYPLFGDDGLQSYSSFLLRNSGNDWEQGNMARDAIIQQIVRGQVGIETQAYNPVVMYLNGEYFGLINMRERYDEDYFAGYHDYADANNVDILKIDGDKKTYRATEGDTLRYKELLAFLNAYSMTNETAYEYVKNNYIDIDNCISYHIAQIYCQNTDWPANNARMWRPRVENGKFRFPLYDTDFGYGLWGDNDPHNLGRLLSSSSSHSWSTVIFRALMKNESFKNEFIQRYAYMINTVYATSRLNSIANNIEGLIATERDTYTNSEWTRTTNYGYNTSAMISWGSSRISVARNYIDSQFGYKGFQTLTVNFTESNGNVYLCSLPVTAGYSGSQYANTPIRLTAEPKDGYRFVRWRSGSTTLSTDPEYFLTITGAYTITAEFESRPTVKNITINELMASNATTVTDETGEYPDWIEFYNSGNTDVDLAGLYITDNSKNKAKHQIPYGYPELTTVPAKGFLVFWADNDTYKGANHLGFKLSSDGDTIILSQKSASGSFTTIDQIIYGTQNTDISFGRYNDGSSNLIIFNVPTPGASNIIQSTANVDGLIITEFMAKNTSTIKEETGGYADWIEIYNSTSNPIDLGGLFITNDLQDPNKYMIPKGEPSKTTIAPKSYYILWADKQTAINPNHLSFNLKAEYGDIAIVQLRGSTNYIIDQVSYTNQGEDISFGRYPNTNSPFRYLPTPTPGAANSNNSTIPEKNGITINELLAANTTVVQDEQSKYSDYIEFYNSSSSAVDLGGLFISDSLSYSLKYRIPRNNSAATTVQPGEWITFWASGHPERGPLHLDFSLSQLGEEVVLSQVTENGIRQLDYISFGQQTPNISYGRYPETHSYWEQMTPTYNAKNQSTSESVDLASLTTNTGTISPQFASNVLNYICLVPEGTTTAPKISATPFNSNATVTITQASSLSGQAKVNIISANGNKTATYTVSFEVAPSSVATLAALSVQYGTLSPSFSPSRSTYTVTVAAPIVPLVTAQPTNPNAHVEIAYAQSVDENTIITVTAESGAINTYIIAHTSQSNVLYTWIDNFNDGSISRFNISGTSASYYTLTAEDGAIKLNQSAGKPTYRSFRYFLPTGTMIDMLNNPNPILKLDVTANKNASLRVDLIASGNEVGNTNTISRDITAGATQTLIYDFTTKCTNIDKSKVIGLIFYTDADDQVNESKQFIFDNLILGQELASNANLASLTANKGTLSPAFNANTLEYTLTIPHNTSTIPTISATKVDTKAILEISQASSIDGQAIVRVTAEDKSTVKTYTINFQRSLETVYGYTEEIIKPNLAGFSENTSTYSFTYGGGTLEVDYYRTASSGSDSFTYNISEADAKILNLSTHPYVSVRLRTTVASNLRIDLFDGNNRVTNANPITVPINGSTYTTYIFDFTNKFNQTSPNATVNAEDIRGITVYFDRGSTTQTSGTVIIDNIIFGNEVDYLANQPPVISSIPNQTRMQTQAFNTILLNNFVSDDNTPAGSLKWTATGGTNISVSISSSNVATITVLNPNFIGSETITFTAKDTDGATSSKEVTFTVTELQIAIESVSFTQTSVSLAQSQTIDLSSYLTIMPSSATIESIIWSSNNENVTISEAGIASHSLEYGSQTVTGTVTVTDKSGNEYVRTINIVITGCPTKLTAINLTPTPATVTEGETLQLVPEYSPTAACIKTVSYTSANTSVATVSANGLVSGLTPGTSVITISVNDGFTTKTANITVTVAKDCSGDIVLSLDEKSTDIILGNSKTLVASITPDDECTQSNTITWTSLNPTVATVLNGKITTLAVGEAVIVATTTGSGIISDTCYVTVLPDCYTGIVNVTVLPKTITLYKTETADIVHAVSPIDACNTTVSWTSIQESVASVVNGTVTALDFGETAIVCTSLQSPTQSDTCIVTVIERMPLSISLAATTSIEHSDTQTLSMSVYPQNADDTSVSWESLDNAIVSVTQAGVITAHTVGTTTIRVTSNRDATVYAECVVTVTPAIAELVELSSYSEDIEVYDVIQLTATISPDHTTDKNIVWTSSNPTVATVDQSGNITAILAGQTTVRATAHNGIYAEATITVHDIDPTEITLSEIALDLQINAQHTITVSFIPTNATNTKLTWSSSDDAVATVNEQGKIQAISVGSAIITVSTTNGKTQTCLVNVTPILADSVTLNSNEITITIDNQQNLIASVYPANTTDKTITWSSANSLIASVDNSGTITAHAEGETVIRATTSNGKYVECIVHVELNIILVESVTVSDKTISMYSNETKSLTATVLPTNASNKTITWLSGNTDIVTIAPNGTITPVQIGTTYVVAKASNGKTDTCVVSVSETPLTNISFSQTSLSLSQDASFNLSSIVTLEPIEAAVSIVWSSSSSSVHITNEGIITNTLDFGTETITVTATATDAYGTEFSKTLQVVLTGCNIPLIALNINHSAVSITEGETQQLIPLYSPSTACIKSITYTSSHTEYATVSETGLITAVQAGTSVITITAFDGFTEKSKTCTVTVTKDCSGDIILSFTEPSLTMVEGTTTTLTTMFTPHDECTQNKTIAWSSSNTAVATVNNGVVTAHAIGPVTITASTDGNGTTTANCEILVLSDCFDGNVEIVATVDTVKLYKNATSTVTASILPNDACIKSITWHSDNENIASVQNGIIRAFAIGETFVVATSVQTPEARDTVRIIVEELLPASIALPSEATVVLEGKTTLMASIEPTHADNKTIYWQSSNPAIVTVSETGEIQGIALGTATITAQTINGHSSTCEVTVLPIDATAIALSQKSLSMIVYDVATISASISPSNTTNTNIEWTSSSPTVASVENGVITALSYGTTTIRATTHNGKIDECVVTVHHLEATEIQLSVSLDSMNVNTTQTIAVAFIPANTTNKQLTWSSNRTDVATVNSLGQITAIAPGTVTITATTSNHKIKTITIVVKPIPATSISLNTHSVNLQESESQQLIAEILPNNASNKTITWTSSNPAIAEVDNTGKIFAKAIGDVRITATTANGLTDTCSVNVRLYTVGVQSVVLSNQSIDMLIGATHHIQTDVYPENATNKTIILSSSKTSVATVNQEGIITAHNVGTTLIIATASNGIADTCQVRVLPVNAEKVTLNIHDLSLSLNESQQLIAEITPANATTKTINWAVNNSAIASVDQTGVVTAHTVGITKLFAYAHNGLYDTCTITVTEISVLADSVKIIASKDSINIDEIIQVHTEFYPVNTTNKTILWSSQNTTIATVTQSGQIKGISAGTAIIEAVASNNVSTTFEITVRELPASSIQLQASSLYLDPAQTVHLEASILPIKTTNKAVVWHSDDTLVATVNEFGLVTAVAPGATYIWATTSNGISTSCEINVNEIIPISMQIDANFSMMVIGDAAQLSISFAPIETTQTTVQWTSSDPSIVEVNSSGLLTARQEGKATIRVSSLANSSVYAEITIDVRLSNAAPVVTDIPSQVILFGNTFPPLNLHDYFSDDNTRPENLRWSADASGTISLQISSSGIATAFITDNSWKGTEIITITAIDEYGLSTSYPVEYVITDKISISSISAGECTVYPNPSTGIFTVSLSNIEQAEYTIELFSPHGTCVFTSTQKIDAQFSHTFDVRHLAKGVYNLVVRSNQKTFTKQIVIQ